jgi:hypothetical protein
MKTPWRHLAWLGLALFLAVGGLGQDGPSLNGSYAFFASAKQNDSFGETGGAILCVLNFDGAGNVSGTAVLKVRSGGGDADTGSGAVRGTYTTNPNGTGSITLDFTDFEFSLRLAMVISDGGKRIQFSDGPGSTGPLALAARLQGTQERVTGVLPGNYFLQNSTGTIPLTLNRTYTGGVFVYSLAEPATATGPVTCPDRTSGTWSATIPSATVVVRDGSNSGNFLMPVVISGCGNRDRFNYSGLANVSFLGGFSLTLQLNGFYVTGTARATTGSAPKGAYGVQMIGEPFPQAFLDVLNFDGSGGITVSRIGSFGTAALTGTYTTNSGGSGTITMTPTANPSAAPTTFAYATADDGATIYLLRTSGGALGANLFSGVGYLQ